MLDYSRVFPSTYIQLSSIHCCCAHLFLPLLLFLPPLPFFSPPFFLPSSSPHLPSSSPPFFLPSSPPPLPSFLSAIPPPHSFQLRFDQFKLRFLEENPNVKDGMRNGWRYLLEGVSAACDNHVMVTWWSRDIDTLSIIGPLVHHWVQVMWYTGLQREGQCMYVHTYLSVRGDRELVYPQNALGCAVSPSELLPR